MKVLNAYCGIGGNRKYWDKEHLGFDVEVTAIEQKPEIADIYQGFYPKDKVIVGDAHEYLLWHYEEYDFIWSSRPCITHTVTNNFLHHQGIRRYPDLALYEEIIFLKSWAKCKWVVENVISYYQPLIRPFQIDRHYFWANFFIHDFKTGRDFNIANARATTRNKDDEKLLSEYHGIYLPKGTKNSRLLLRNCVYPPLGLHILNESKRDIQPELFKKG